MVSIDPTEFQAKTTPRVSGNIRPSMTSRVWDSYVDMRGATEGFIAEKPSESRLLMVVMLSNLFFILSWSIKAVITPTSSAAAVMGAELMIWFLIAMMMRITIIYATALVIGGICKVMGGTASMQDTRAGIFWGAFVAAPFGLLVAGLASVIANYDQMVPAFQHQGVQMMPYWLGMVPFIWFIAKGAAAANRMENSIPLFGTLSAICVALGFGVKFMATGSL